MRSHTKASSAGSTQRQANSLSRVYLACVCAFALLAFCGSSASRALAAVTPKVPIGSFGATGTEGGSFNTPEGVAVDQGSGNVYVVDSKNHRVSAFDSSGVFLRAFGQDVVSSGPGDNGTGFEICVASDGDVCKAGSDISAISTGGAMRFPRGVAVDAAGDVYVSEGLKRRVQKFDAGGNFLLTFGQDVIAAGQPNDTGTGFEVCVVASECKAGLSAATGGGFAGGIGGQLAVAPPGSPNAGNVLVTDPGRMRVQEFTSSGAFVRAFGFDVIQEGSAGDTGTGFEVCEVAGDCQGGLEDEGSGVGQFGQVSRVAEDADGNIYTVEPEEPSLRVQKFTLPGNVVTPQGNFCEAVCSGTSEFDAPVNVTIDPATKNVLVAKRFPEGATPSCPLTGEPSVEESRIVEVSPAGALEATHMACAGINVNGLAMRSSAATGDVYVATTDGGSRLLVLNTPLTAPSVGFNAITDVSAHSATVSGFVNPNGPADLPYAFTTRYHFAYKRSADSDFTNLGADLGRGTTNLLVSLKLPGLEAGTSYDVQLVATKPSAGAAGIASTAIFSFATPAAPAQVGIPSATTASTQAGARAALWGSVTPNSKPTTYRFEYGTSTDYGTKAPAPEVLVGSNAAKVPVAQFIDGLQPDTTYHFRIVAKNVNGTVASPNQTFTTPPLVSEMPDNRGAELVSPADKGPSGSVSNFFGLIEPAQLFNQASENGDGIVYPIQNGISTSTAGGWTRWRADRTPSGWFSTQISAPSLIPPSGTGFFGVTVPSFVFFASPDLSCAILRTVNPLTADTPQQSIELGVENLYRWSADGDYELITSQVPLNAGANIAGNVDLYSQVDASDDCSRIYFRSLYELISGASSLYEWDEGVLRDAGVLPNGAMGEEMVGESGSVGSVGPAVVGGALNLSAGARWNAITPDGSLFFTAISNEGADRGEQAVFMRKDGAGAVDISQSQTAVPANGARFEAASRDGSRVFFRANYAIAAASSAGPTTGGCGSLAGETVFTGSLLEAKPCDLYAYDVETGDLTDLSADANPADPIGAAVQGTVAIDEDGSHVYFAALGQLVPGKGKTYIENIAGEGSANIYLSHDGELAYVTTLKMSDLKDGALMRKTGTWNAETTADGRQLLFEVAANLTGYDSGGGRAAYLYSADTGEVTCVSCPLDGSPTLVGANGQVDPTDFTSPHVLARDGSFLTHRPSSMSEDGSRVFFTSPDVLALGGVVGKRNVYEWKNGQVYFLAIADPSAGSGLGEYLDASASGDDVFIATREQLAPQDKDFVADVYDLRVDGGFPAEVVPVPCDPAADECQGPPSAQPPAPSPTTAGFSGPGNPPESKPRPRTCPKGKVRRRGKCVKRGQQSTKRKRNRATKTNRGGAK